MSHYRPALAAKLKPGGRLAGARPLAAAQKGDNSISAAARCRKPPQQFGHAELVENESGFRPYRCGNDPCLPGWTVQQFPGIRPTEDQSGRSMRHFGGLWP